MKRRDGSFVQNSGPTRGLGESPKTALHRTGARVARSAGERERYAYKRTDLGGLVYYGPNITEMFRRAATYVDKIVKGARPADLPVEQPTKFDLIINLKAARSAHTRR